MEIRKVNENRDIKQTDIEFRKASQAIVKSYYSGRAVTGAVRKTASAAGSTAKFGLRLAKDSRRTKETRTLLKFLTKEQRKQWNSYSFRKQTSILKQTEQITAKKAQTKGINTHKISTTEKAIELQGELHKWAYGAPDEGIRSDRWDVSVAKGKTAAEMKKNLKKGDMKTVTFYSDNIKRGAKKVKKIEGRYKKAKKQEKAEGRMLYVSSFLSLLDKEGKKANQIRRAQKEDQFNQSELENQTSSAMVGYMMVPLKTSVQAAVKKAMRKAAEAAGGMLLKFLLVVLLPLLCVFLFFMIAINITGGGSPESESGAISIGEGGYSPTGSQIVAYAMEWIGTPYVWGVADLNVAVDCSGFTYCVYAHFGIVLPRTSFEQGNTEQGQFVKSLEDAIPGDLIWWTPRHVGIYIGNGQAVQSSGDETNYNLANAGKGVCIVPADYREIGTIRRFVTDASAYGGIGTGGFAVDSTEYTPEQMELIWAVVAQEDCGSYEGSLAVITSAMNRTESPIWNRCGSNAYEQLTASGQYCYSSSIGGNWQGRLHGNVPAYTKQAVYDCLINGVRNHNFTCFRSTNSVNSDRVKIGGNWYYSEL